MSQYAYGQSLQNVTVSSNTPCFLNNTAGYKMWENCNAADDWLVWAIAPFEWVTGGWFSLILVSVIILITYLKYHKTVYPMIIGILFIPIAFTLFPSNWINLALILAVFSSAILIYKAVFRQTKEY
jgi:hypothetical protein